MESWRIHENGDESGLRRETVDAPRPAAGEVAIRVAACGLNFADLLMLKGSYQTMPPLPFAPGAEVCGRVEALGEGVETHWLGARVAAYCGHGGFAEIALAPVAACVRVPDAMGDAEAAALPVAHGSAEIALVRRARLKAGEWLLVGGAGSGVGLTAVEIGALLGARVIGLARGAEKQAAARRAGAALVLDPEAFDPETRALSERIRAETGGRGVDVVYDPVGGMLGKAMERAAAFEARILPIGFASGDVPVYRANHLLVKNVEVIGFWWGAYFQHAPEAIAQSMARLFGWAAAGRIAPLVSLRVPFDDAPAALAALRARRHPGKIVLTDYPASAART